MYKTFDQVKSIPPKRNVSRQGKGYLQPTAISKQRLS